MLMSRRLFEITDADAAEQAARAYRQVYEKTPGLYDSAVLTPDYLEQQKAAYPLHPELIDVLYKKWSTAPDFPRTRATLQLLAGVVADQWRNRREAHTIQSAHVDLERERIRTRIVSAAGAGGGYDGVVAADIIGRDAHADMQDERRGGDYSRFQIARGVATTLLMHSFGGMERGGGTLQELRLGTVAPNVGPEYVPRYLAHWRSPYGTFTARGKRSNSRLGQTFIASSLRQRTVRRSQSWPSDYALRSSAA